MANSLLRSLGSKGPPVFPIALGCMGMSGAYGPADEQESIATIHAALDAGVNLLDTGDFYGAGRNELLIGRALQGKRDQALLSVKFGAMRAPGGAFVGIDTSPRAVKNSLAYTLTRLAVDYIDIYRPARLDPQVPIEETIGAIAEMVKAGYVRHIGLSEVGAETIRRASNVHPIVDLQIEYSLVSRSAEEKVFPALRELGIGVTAYGVLSRGLLTGSLVMARTDSRAHMPRFTAENRAQNAKLVEALAQFAKEKNATPAQVSVAWVMSRWKAIVPVMGARTRKQLAESLSALDLVLSPAEMARLETLVSPNAVAGTRYAPEQMKSLDSER